MICRVCVCVRVSVVVFLFTPTISIFVRLGDLHSFDCIGSHWLQWFALVGLVCIGSHCWVLLFICWIGCNGCFGMHWFRILAMAKSYHRTEVRQLQRNHTIISELLHLMQTSCNMLVLLRMVTIVCKHNTSLQVHMNSTWRQCLEEHSLWPVA